MRFFIFLASSCVGSLNFVQGSSSVFNRIASCCLNPARDIEGSDSDDPSAGSMFKDVDSDHDDDQEIGAFVPSSPRKENNSPFVQSSRYHSPATTDESRDSPFEPVINSRKSSSASLPILIPARAPTQKEVDEFISARLKSVNQWNNMRRRIPEYISFQEPLEEGEKHDEFFSEEYDTDVDLKAVFGSLSDDDLLI